MSGAGVTTMKDVQKALMEIYDLFIEDKTLTMTQMYTVGSNDSLN